MNTNWSSPKTNIFAGLLDLRRALASGQNAKLVRMRNEDCSYPIKEKNQNLDFRNYEFSIGYGSSINKIKEDPSRSEFEKQLTLNYVNCYGTEEAVKRYYETGEVSEDNFRGMGRSHLVKVDDVIKFLRDTKQYERANIYERQYRSPEHVNDVTHFFDFYRYKHGSPYAVKNFKRKLWVVVLLGDKEEKPRIPVMVHVLNFLMYPTKFIPRRSVLRMPEYTNYTFRVGDVIHGLSVEFQIPKRFSFK
jgi:hypothetical protein